MRVLILIKRSKSENWENFQKNNKKMLDNIEIYKNVKYCYIRNYVYHTCKIQN